MISGIPAPYIPSSATRRIYISKASSIQNSTLDSKSVRLDGNIKIDNKNASGDSTVKTLNSVRTNAKHELKTSNLMFADTKTKQEIGNKVINSSQVKTASAAPKIKVNQENLDISEKSLKDSATITIPIHPVPNGATLVPKYKTMPSPTRTSNSVLNSSFKGIPELSVATGESTPMENRINRKGITSINYEQRRSKFHKARTASCSSSDASDDDSESRKKRAHKISIEKNNQRRDSHDDSSDSQDRGGNGGVGGNPASGLGNSGDGMHNQDQSSTDQGNRSTGSGDHSSSDSHQRQCNGENFRRSRRRTGETRLRESQSLNRIMEVQESEANYSVGTTEVFRERLKKNESDVQKDVASNSNNCSSINLEKNKSSKSLGARFLQSWSNTISSTKLSVQKRKFSSAEGRSSRAGESKTSEFTEQLPKNYSDEKENKALIEKTGKKMKVLGRYFQVRLFL